MSAEKDRLAMWKLYMSTLFARRMNYLVTGFDNGEWLFTDILPEHVQRNVVTSDDVLQFVRFNKPEIQGMIIESFPLLGKASVVVNIKTISGFINKFGIDKVKLVLENGRVIRLKIDGTDDHAQLSDLTCVGMLLSQYELNYYIGYYNRFISRKSLEKYLVVLSPINLNDLTSPKGDVNCIKVHSRVPDTNEVRWFRLPMIDGKNYPSVIEYCKKANVTPSTFNAELLWRQRSVEAVIAYDDENVSVRSVCPRRIWYPILEK
jgi:hypothetical protein